MSILATPRAAADGDLRARAAAICDAYAKRDNILARVPQFDAETKTRVDDYEQRIAELADCSPEDIASIQQRLILAEQKKTVIAQRERERKSLLVQVQGESAAAVVGIDLATFFSDAHAAELTRAVASMMSFFETESRARDAAGRADSVNALWRWTAQIVYLVPPEHVVNRLRRFVAGEVPVWQI